MGRVRKQIKKQAAEITKPGGSKIHESPAMPVRGAAAAGHLPPARPAGMSDDEFEYRTMLQEAIRWATAQLMEEMREEILVRAKARVKTLRELRG